MRIPGMAGTVIFLRHPYPSTAGEEEPYLINLMSDRLDGN
jgi:hypothetical protein